jgi:cation diffusion facilitator family transporter
MSTKKADRDHPFGHGRIEYITGLIISLLIIIMGAELLISAVGTIKSPEPLEVSGLLFAILIASILIKAFMFIYNKIYGKKINSPVMLAVASDSLADVVSTFIVTCGMIIYHILGINLDGVLGGVVGLFVIWTGYNSCRETLAPLLGIPPSKELVDEILSITLSHKIVLGVHDLIVHDYGPTRVFITLHAEVNYKDDVLKIHDEIDNIEKELSEKLNCLAVIHMDPIVLDDPEISSLKEAVINKLEGFAPECSIHDFRMVRGDTHTNLIFDLLMPYEYELSPKQIKTRLREFIKSIDSKYEAVIEIDREMV